MAITKILAKHVRLDVLINYALNGDKTEDRLLTAYHNCTPNDPYMEMKQTKENVDKLDGVQAYHIIQSFAKGEISPELALDIAQQFVHEHLPGYEAVIGVHVDKEHVHAHIVFNSVNKYTGKKYHSNAESYYRQIRTISDRLCREHGLSVILTGDKKRSISYAEWLRQQSGEPSFRSMLEADLRRAIEDANDYGHFLVLMENMGYEVKHGSRLSFAIRGTQKWYVPGRKNPLFTEDGIRRAIIGNFEAIEAGLRPVVIPRPHFVPYKKQTKYTGFLALYVHYLYLLGKIKKQEYPTRITPHLKAAILKFESYKAQFQFLQKHGLSTQNQLSLYIADTEKRISDLLKQRTVLNVKKKKRMPLYKAIADVNALKPAKTLYDEGVTGIEDEFVRYLNAVEILEKAGVGKEQIAQEKAQLYESIADVNREIFKLKKELTMCRNITDGMAQIQKDIHTVETKRNKEQARDNKRQI